MQTRTWKPVNPRRNITPDQEILRFSLTEKIPGEWIYKATCRALSVADTNLYLPQPCLRASASHLAADWKHKRRYSLMRHRIQPKLWTAQTTPKESLKIGNTLTSQTKKHDRCNLAKKLASAFAVMPQECGKHASKESNLPKYDHKNQEDDHRNEHGNEPSQSKTGEVGMQSAPEPPR